VRDDPFGPVYEPVQSEWGQAVQCGYNLCRRWNGIQVTILGQAVPIHTWVSTIVIALGGGLLSLPVIGRYRRRVIFWM
jgi:hypothetical protein